MHCALPGNRTVLALLTSTVWTVPDCTQPASTHTGLNALPSGLFPGQCSLLLHGREWHENTQRSIFLFLLVTVTELMEDSNCCMEFKQELHLEAFNKEVQVKYDWPVSTCDRTTASPHLYFNDTMEDIHSLSRRSECNIFQRYLFHLCCPSLSRGNESGNYHQQPGSTINSKGENPIKSSLWYSRHI